MAKKNFYLILDVETANSVEDALVYDIGGAVVDKKGNIYESFSFVIREVFDDEMDLMQTAYYNWKLPKYFQGLRENAFARASLYQAKMKIRQLILSYGIKWVLAYNAHFDSTALNKTERYITKSKYRWFLPYGVKIGCIWHMACQVVCTQKTYKNWARTNGFTSAKGNIVTNAETVYAYISNQDEFEEQHTGLEDVKIETAIMAHCFRQKKKMDLSINRSCWRIPQG